MGALRPARAGAGLSDAAGPPQAIATEHRPAGRWISSRAVRFRASLPTAGLMLGVPCYGGMLSTATLRGLLETQRVCLGLGIPFTCITTTNESLVARARNTIAAHFLASTCSHLLFVDADIGFGADAALRLLGHGRPLIGALYRRKDPAREAWVVNWLASADGSARRDETTGAVEVASIGTGFLCIAREVLERLAAALPATRYRPDDDEPGPGGAWRAHAHALFDSGVDPASGRYLSEDYLFCQRWRAIGGEVWCDPAILLEHHGQACFAGDPMTLFGAP